MNVGKRANVANNVRLAGNVDCHWKSVDFTCSIFFLPCSALIKNLDLDKEFELKLHNVLTTDSTQVQQLEASVTSPVQCFLKCGQRIQSTIHQTLPPRRRCFLVVGRVRLGIYGSRASCTFGCLRK